MHHSGPGRLARPYPVEDFHLLFFASLSWRTPQWVRICRLGLACLLTGMRTIPAVPVGCPLSSVLAINGRPTAHSADGYPETVSGYGWRHEQGE